MYEPGNVLGLGVYSDGSFSPSQRDTESSTEMRLVSRKLQLSVTGPGMGPGG